MRYSPVIIFGILSSLGIIFTPVDLFAQTDEVTTESITQNQTKINLSINGSVMITSGIIIGFMGFSSITSLGLIIKDIKEHLILTWTLYGLIGIMIILHLTVIWFAAVDQLSQQYYLFVIISTIAIIIAIIVLTAYLFYRRATYDQRLHQAQNIFKDVRNRSTPI